MMWLNQPSIDKNQQNHKLGKQIFFLPNLLMTYLPTKPVAPNTVQTTPLKELRPPRPLFTLLSVTFLFSVTSTLLCLVLVYRAPHVCGRLTPETKMSRVMRKPMIWFPTWSDTNQAVQLQKMARGLKFWI